MMMMNGWFLVGVSVAYLILLFVIAYYGDKSVERGGVPKRRPIVYGLAFTIYCTSWSIYGTTAQTAQTGWLFPPTYVGTILLFVFGAPILAKLIATSKKHNVTSVADFISSRYGKSRKLAILATALALLCVIPYIALQLKAVAESLDILRGAHTARGIFPDTALLVTVVMGAFAILFGARRTASTDQNHGLMLAIAFEAVFKLVAFVVIGLFAFFSLPGGLSSVVDSISLAPAVSEDLANAGRYAFWASAVLGVTSLICLPRQFHVLVVENVNQSDLRPARFLFVGYLIAMGVFIWPITMAAMNSGAASASGGYHVLLLPLQSGHAGLALLAYLGGFSAATGMVIVATVALGIMVANDVVTPVALTGRNFGDRRDADLSALLRSIRRWSIAFLLILAYGYYRLIGNAEQLASTGLLSMALAAQFAPAIIGGLYWKTGHANGAAAGLIVGFLFWVYTMLAPTLAQAGWVSGAFVAAGPFGVEWLRPGALFGLDGWDAIAHGLFWSLLANSLVYITVSLQSAHNLSQGMQAATFVELGADAGHAAAQNIRNDDLIAVAGRFIGVKAATKAFENFFQTRGGAPSANEAADRATLVFAERLLAGAIGAASARIVLQSTGNQKGVRISDVVSIADETSKVFRFNRELLQASMDNVSVGIAVVDKALRLVAWNNAYERLYPYPEGFLFVGRHARDLLQYNAEQGEFGDAGPELEIEKRLRHLRAATPYTFLREREDGRVLEIRGNPMPGGGFVTSYTDVSEFKRAELALQEMNETLEKRVDERTSELTRTNAALSLAKAEAERANRSKTRFFAAVSHDVLQPLNAARLFATAIRQKSDDDKLSPVVGHLDASLNAVQELLGQVLDLSKLDAGGVEPEIQSIPLGPIFDELAAEFAPLAQEKGLELIVAPSSLVTKSDRSYLRRIIQNLLSNAIRYTPEGRVLLGARRRAGSVRIEVWDTGPGIPAEDIETIFSEFRRLPANGKDTPKGLGLGLAIVDRISALLKHKVTVRSAVGKGSMFAVTAPISAEISEELAPVHLHRDDERFAGARVLCIDNDETILIGMKTVLDGWGCVTATAKTLNTAIELPVFADTPPQLLLVDYHLDDGANGIDAIRALRAHWGGAMPVILISADQSEQRKRDAASAGCKFLSKPVRPAALRALMSALLARKRPMLTVYDSTSR